MMVMTQWNHEKDKLFEQAIVMFPAGYPNRWERIAVMVGESPESVQQRYLVIEQDVKEIHEGRVHIPKFTGLLSDPGPSNSHSANHLLFSSKPPTNKKKGEPWTKEEHRQFLKGMEIYGKGNWKSISKNILTTRTHNQIASHAQKFFIRQNDNSTNKRKRSSIHDITTTSTKPEPMDQNQITPPSLQIHSVPNGLPRHDSLPIQPDNPQILSELLMDQSQPTDLFVIQIPSYLQMHQSLPMQQFDLQIPSHHPTPLQSLPMNLLNSQIPSDLLMQQSLPMDQLNPQIPSSLPMQHQPLPMDQFNPQIPSHPPLQHQSPPMHQFKPQIPSSHPMHQPQQMSQSNRDKIPLQINPKALVTQMISHHYRDC